MIRFFALENEYGNRLNLNSPKNGIFTEPEGLGYEINATYSKIGSSFIQNFMQDKQQTISGTIVFGGVNAYQGYQNFTGFINSSLKIKLLYKTDAGEYYRDIDVISLGKTEITQKMVMECPVRFICKSLFYANHINRFKIERVEGEVRWAFRWPARFNDYGSRKIIFNNNGHVAAPFELELYVYCENPSIKVNQNGIELAVCKFPTILQENEKIIYSSLDGNLYCYRIGKNKKENFTGKLDINNTNFFKLPTGDCEVEFTSDTGAQNRTMITIYKFFRTV